MAAADFYSGLFGRDVQGAGPRAGRSLMMPPFDVMERIRITAASDVAGAAFGLWRRRSTPWYWRLQRPGSVSWNELNTGVYQRPRDSYSQVLGYTYSDLDGGEVFAYATTERATDSLRPSTGQLRHLPGRGSAVYWLK